MVSRHIAPKVQTPIDLIIIYIYIHIIGIECPQGKITIITKHFSHNIVILGRENFSNYNYIRRQLHNILHPIVTSYLSTVYSIIRCRIQSHKRSPIRYNASNEISVAFCRENFGLNPLAGCFSKHCLCYSVYQCLQGTKCSSKMWHFIDF